MAVNAAANSTTSALKNSLTGGQTVNTSSILKKDDFLKMLVAQLKNQDPISPVDSKEFLSQNAMFTNLERLENIEALLTQSQGLQKSTDRLLTAAYLGKEVTASIPSNTVGGAPTQVSGLVTGMTFNGDSSELLLDNGKSVSLNNVISVKLPMY